MKTEVKKRNLCHLNDTILSTGVMASANYLSILSHPATERIDRGATWSDPEVDELLNIWTNENVQAELKEATIKKHIFERIARNLRDKGFYRTAEQCREKIKRLKKEYRQAKNNNYRCVRGRATVKFFPRLQAVLDGKPGGGNGAPIGNLGVNFTGSDYVSSRLESSGGGAHGSGTPSYLGRKGSPHSFSDYTSEEIKVEVNPAEVDNDSFNNSEAGDDGDDNDVDLPRHAASSRHFSSSRGHYLLNNALLHSAIPTAAHHAISLAHHHHHHRQNHNHQALALTVNHHPLNYSNNNNTNGGGGGGGVSGGRLSEDECGSEASSSRATSPMHQRSNNNNRPLSPTDSMDMPRRKKMKKSNFSIKETLDAALGLFLKHQKEAEERLYAWEERRIQLELEAEERWRQEDRDLLRQVFAQIYIHCSTSTATNTEPEVQQTSSNDE